MEAREYLVLEGTFSDEIGDYSEGYYVRNPPGSRHHAFTEGGCTILVKLWQFAVDDSRR
ncbi:MAG: cupin domain-containing protein [Thiolinea sp.]